MATALRRATAICITVRRWVLAEKEIDFSVQFAPKKEGM